MRRETKTDCDCVGELTDFGGKETSSDAGGQTGEVDANGIALEGARSHRFVLGASETEKREDIESLLP